MSPRPSRSPPRRPGRGGDPSESRRAGAVQSLDRALRLLETLARAGRGLTLSELAREVDLAPSTAHRLLATLLERRFVAFDPERGLYRVGVEAFAVGSAFLAHRDLVATARAHLQALMEASGESANLGILDQGEVVFVSQVECHEMVRMLAPLGARVPAHASGTGKALLAALTPAQVRAIIARRGLARLTRNTLVRPEALARGLARVRRLGYAVDDEEQAVGLRCVAATVHDEHGEPVGAVSLSGPRARITDERLDALGTLVARATAEITEALGGRLPAWRRRGAEPETTFEEHDR